MILLVEKWIYIYLRIFPIQPKSSKVDPRFGSTDGGQDTEVVRGRNGEVCLPFTTDHPCDLIKPELSVKVVREGNGIWTVEEEIARVWRHGRRDICLLRQLQVPFSHRICFVCRFFTTYFDPKSRFR